jgi:glucuronate isomerase
MSFITDDFLLQNSFAKKLYHDYAAGLPIIDYHNHLPPQEIAENRVFENIGQVWLAGNYHRCRALCVLGINEKYITGKATEKRNLSNGRKPFPKPLETRYTIGRI